MKKFIVALLIALMMVESIFAGQWIQNGDAWMYQDDEGDFITGEQKKIDNNFYYFGEDGCMLTGYQHINNDYYVFNEDGTPKNEPIVYNGKTYNVTGRGKISNMTPEIFEKIQENEFITNTGELAGELNFALKLVNAYPISKRILRWIFTIKGTTTDKVEYVIANINIDWKEQAVKCAKKYLEYKIYDRNTLTSILILEGFTEAEAKYGAEKCIVNLEEGITVGDMEKQQDMAKYAEEMKQLAKLIS